MKAIDKYINEKNENMSCVSGLFNNETECTKITNEQMLLYRQTNKEFVENHLKGIKMKEIIVKIQFDENRRTIDSDVVLDALCEYFKGDGIIGVLSYDDGLVNESE